MSHGTYSASSFIASSTMRVASMTSLPMPSPGIHAIEYLAIAWDSEGEREGSSRARRRRREGREGYGSAMSGATAKIRESVSAAALAAAPGA